ncbi:MAG: Glutathione S-transferase domain protein [Burkholderiaceae bacterium]|nr:Glutathione S-transferase domain protein [Burkholderiaceae bacterium]
MNAAVPDELTLYIDSNYSSPYAMFAYIALKEKKLPYTLRQINIREKLHRTPEFQKLSLTVKVPTLIHGDFSLAESSAIIEYLEDVFPTPAYQKLLPTDVRQLARARQIQAWLRSDLFALREDRPTTVIFVEPVATPLSEAGRADADKLLTLAERLIGDDGGNLFGEWSIVDTELALTLNRLVANGDPVAEKLRRYVAAQWQRPSLQAWLRHEP